MSMTAIIGGAKGADEASPHGTATLAPSTRRSRPSEVT